MSFRRRRHAKRTRERRDMPSVPDLVNDSGHFPDQLCAGVVLTGLFERAGVVVQPFDHLSFLLGHTGHDQRQRSQCVGRRLGEGGGVNPVVVAHVLRPVRLPRFHPK